MSFFKTLLGSLKIFERLLPGSPGRSTTEIENPMDERQKAIRDKIVAVMAGSESNEIVYQSEWLGYVPFGVYHWVEYQGKDLSGDFPFGWSLEDLVGLQRIGFLEQLEAYENPEDQFDRCIRYRVWLSIPLSRTNP
ncbi:hypothetical protein [Pseudomonas citri]|uniref:hypothetical protein n=1 Tax=Pseudomonas citri TaxID=2978349 RepID=UPI0021B60CF6|nr:hypothetical protein [Pseudomonas citri]